MSARSCGTMALLLLFPVFTAACAQDNAVIKIEPERRDFRALLLGNPNYFGNLKQSPFKSVKVIQANRRYEEIECVGFNPDFGRLEAVVLIKRNAGYGGNVCSSGTPEFVRFYLSYNDGATWEDQGVTSFRAYDIPGDKPLEYAVTLRIDAARKLCIVENLPKVRAILSWNVLPPPNVPDFTPVWGNVKETNIQIDVKEFLVLGGFLEQLQIDLPKKYKGLFELSQPLKVAEQLELSGSELHALYQKTDVQPHRYLYTQIEKMMSGATSVAPQSIAADPALQQAQLAEIDWPLVIGALLETDGDTRYEELDCVGLDTRLSSLVAVLTIKRPTGFSGNLCQAGSTEYVAFWVDWGGGSWDYVGTSSVNVHDISSIPADGLKYSVFLPADVASRRQPCWKGAKTAKVRAILSWQTPPPPSNPNWVPHWGNREETLVHITPGPVLGDKPAPFIEAVADMAIPKIGPATGLANGTAVVSGFTAVDSPFGGLVTIAGHILPAPDLSSGAAALEYRVSVRQFGSTAWERLNNTFNVNRTQLLDGSWSFLLPAVTQSAPDGWYPYREDPVGGPGNAQVFVAGNVLARWQTAGRNGMWQIKIEARDASDTIFAGSQIIKVRLDNIAPFVAIDITSGGGACADFTIGELIDGTYVATDLHFYWLRLSVSPGLGGSFTVPSPYPGLSTMPLRRAYSPTAPPGVPTSGESGIWQLNTSGMPRCGYVVRVHVRDRTIVNSGFVGRERSAVVGLCLREPGE